MLSILVNSLLIGYSGAMMPGSLLTYTIDKSLSHGKRSGLIISLGHALLELLLTVLLLLGLGPVLATVPAQIFVGLAGGLVLLWMAYGMINSVLKGTLAVPTGNTAKKADKGMLLSGAVISASNPYFIIWWTAVGLSLMLSAWSQFGLLGVAVFYIGHILADITWYTFLSVLIAKTRNFMNLKAYRAIILCLGLLLVYFSTKFILHAISLFT